MLKLPLSAILFSAGALFAQTAQTTAFRALMTQAGGNSAAADILVHVIRDSSGNIVSGSVDFNVTYHFANDEVVTGLSIPSLASVVTAAAPLQLTAGTGEIDRQAQPPAAALTGLLANPGQFSVILTAADLTMTAPLQSAAVSVRMAMLTSSAGTATATVRVVYTGPPYAFSSAEVLLQAAYQFPSQVQFSGLRIYSGTRIALAAALAPGFLSGSSGTGLLAPPPVEIDMSDPQMVQAAQTVLNSPSSLSLQLDTVENAAAPLTGSLRGTDVMNFQVPALGSVITLYTLRDNSGNVTAGTVLFDVNYRFTAATLVSQVDIDANIIAPPVHADPSGSGNAYLAAGVGAGTGLASLNGIVSDPEAHLLDVRASTSATALSAPLAPAVTALPVIAAVIPIVEVKDLSTFAPGELVEIYGTNLAKVTTDLSGWPGGSLPASLNGVSVNVGGQAGRILYVSPNQVDALLAFETPVGAHTLTLDNGNGLGAGLPLNLAAIAPAVYNLAFKNADFSLVGASNPAHAGDVLVLYTTGMGQTSPALVTGQTTPTGPPFFDTAPVTATMAGVSAGVIYSIAAPPYVTGLYQLALTVPAGIGSGSVPLVIEAGGLPSNTILLEVQ